MLKPLRVKNFRQEERQRSNELYERRREDLPAVIKSVAGSTHSLAQPEMTWVSILNQPHSRVLVFNGTVANVAETPVWVGPRERPGDPLEIKGIYKGSILPTSDSGGNDLNIPPHGNLHQVPSEDNVGPDPVYVWQPMWKPFKTGGNDTNLTVTTLPLFYVHNGYPRDFYGQNTDLTSLVPASASKKRRVLIYLDLATNILTTLAGTEVDDVAGITAPFPQVPSGARASAWVLLANGQTSITTATHVKDARDLSRGESGLLRLIGGEMLGPIHKVAITEDAPGSSYNVDLSVAEVFNVTLNEACTFDTVNPPSSGFQGKFRLILEPEGYAPTFPTSWIWTGASSITTTAGTYTIIDVFTINGGITYFATLVGTGFGNVTSDNQPAYMTGPILVEGSKSGYAHGQDDIADNQVAYLTGPILVEDNQSGYLVGQASAQDSQSVYLAGQDSSNDNQTAYVSA